MHESTNSQLLQVGGGSVTAVSQLGCFVFKTHAIYRSYTATEWGNKCSQA